MQPFVRYYLPVSLLTNSLLAVVAFWLYKADFKGSTQLCYVVAAVSIGSGVGGLASILLHDYRRIVILAALAIHAGATILVFAGIYSGYGVACGGDAGPDCTLAIDSTTALYFSVVTWTTLGYGDFSPPEPLRMLAAIEAGVGYLYLGLIIGLVGSLIDKDKASVLATPGPTTP